MKINSLLFACIASFFGNNSSSAFVVPCSERAATATSISLSEQILEVEEIYQEQQEIAEEPVCLLTLTDMKFSKAMPFMRRPQYLTGCMPGDVGFDPLGFVESEKDLIRNREAELKHGRLAMLAAAGWPLSEFFQKKIASIINTNLAIDTNGIDLNFWFVIISFGVVVELLGKKGNFPGDLGFDPLGLYPDNVEEQKRMEKAEVKHGRLAMIVLAVYFIEKLAT
jgi:hypothetical protein